MSADLQSALDAMAVAGSGHVSVSRSVLPGGRVFYSANFHDDVKCYHANGDNLHRAISDARQKFADANPDNRADAEFGPHFAQVAA